MTVVLDSWAVLAYLDGAEPAAGLIDEVVQTGQTVMSWINVGEVLYVVERRHGAEAARDVVRDLRPLVDLRLPDELDVRDAAHLKAGHAMSYADAYCAALARSVRGEVWTGDPELLVETAQWEWRDLRT